MIVCQKQNGMLFILIQVMKTSKATLKNNRKQTPGRPDSGVSAFQLQEVVEMRNGAAKQVQKKMFPGYASSWSWNR